MTDYKKYINALRKCAKEHEDDRTSFGHIIVSDLCRDTANLMESLEQESTAKENLVVEDCISRAEAIDALGYDISIESDEGLDAYKTVIKEMLCKIYDVQKENIEKLSSIQPKTDVLGKIRAEIEQYEADCRLQGGTDECEKCNSNVFGSVYRIIDKYTAESEDKG